MQIDPNQHDPSSNDWDVCPTGELSQMAARLDAAQRRASRNRLYGGTLACTALFAVVVLSVGSFLNSDGVKHGGIGCRECMSNFAAYHDHLTEANLLADAKLIASMATHLEKCDLCRGEFNAAYPGVLVSNLSAVGRPLQVAMLPRFTAEIPLALY
ncbi:MAG: hypothetical protein MI725_00730 [Pirellulales bacterium]|nr:hypothetical protein [Pirellulales bacterium]